MFILNLVNTYTECEHLNSNLENKFGSSENFEMFSLNLVRTIELSANIWMWCEHLDLVRTLQMFSLNSNVLTILELENSH